jgi:adenylate cyclase class 2
MTSFSPEQRVRQAVEAILYNKDYSLFFRNSQYGILNLMEIEIEAKFVDVNADHIRISLKALGAQLVHPECVMRRRNYDFPDGKLESISAWVRIRDEGKKVTMSYKQNKDDGLHGTVEVNVGVDNFDATGAFLEAVGMGQKSYQETKRESWLLDGVEVTIDTWPWIPPFVELEGHSEAAVKGVAKKLGFDWANALHGSVATVYQMHYNVTADEVNAWKLIDFQPIPVWLEKTRRPSSEQVEELPKGTP